MREQHAATTVHLYRLPLAGLAALESVRFPSDGMEAGDHRPRPFIGFIRSVGRLFVCMAPRIPVQAGISQLSRLKVLKRRPSHRVVTPRKPLRYSNFRHSLSRTQGCELGADHMLGHSKSPQPRHASEGPINCQRITPAGAQWGHNVRLALIQGQKKCPTDLSECRARLPTSWVVLLANALRQGFTTVGANNRMFVVPNHG